VGSAIQDLTARRLGRGFVPLGFLLVLGVWGMVRHGPLAADHLFVAVGAPVSALAMLFYGLRAVRKAFGGADAAWMRLAAATGLFPFLYGLYLLAFRGLRPLAGLPGAFAWATLVEGALFLLLSCRLLWTLWRLTEVQTLAGVMVLGPPEEEG
jgi:hypothetical protein